MNVPPPFPGWRGRAFFFGADDRFPAGWIKELKAERQWIPTPFPGPVDLMMGVLFFFPLEKIRTTSSLSVRCNPPFPDHIFSLASRAHPDFIR